MVKNEGKLVDQMSLHCLMHWFSVKEVEILRKEL